MSRSPPLFHSGPTEPPGPGRSLENGLDPDQDPDEDLDDEVDASRLERFMKDRRRAQSLPAYPAELLDRVPEEEEGRKRVKFADALGLNLASVKHFSALEEPQIPSKVLSRHRSFPPPQDFLCHGLKSVLDTDRLVTCFPEPRDADGRVRELRVCLEKVSITQFDVRGQIRALSGGGEAGVREVGVRYTFNEWLSHVDAQALPVSAEPPGLVGQRFAFTVYTPPVMDPSSAVHFAVFLRGDDGEFWDNNRGHNYTLRYRCMPGNEGFVSAAFHAI